MFNYAKTSDQLCLQFIVIMKRHRYNETISFTCMLHLSIILMHVLVKFYIDFSSDIFINITFRQSENQFDLICPGKCDEIFVCFSGKCTESYLRVSHVSRCDIGLDVPCQHSRSRFVMLYQAPFPQLKFPPLLSMWYPNFDGLAQDCSNSRAPSQYKDGHSRYVYFHYKDNTVMEPPYLYNGNSCTGKTTSLY